ncbi:hypothetical protein QB794_004439 [Salmonella enterica]|nr:hypothetical protein [Salmonella enterica]EJW2034471.1 hypothetical protein [Salmonella enterica]EJW2039978.1 hypothetical protein [Salmonella enterica]EJW2071160.1 hypothetical protein [Salmonella enterica]EJW2080189.1 hypothetical protein [Salmonella enterica]
MDTEQYKRELIYRRGNGKSILDAYKEKILSLFNINYDDITFLSLQQTDEIIYSQRKNRKQYSKEKFPANDLMIIFNSIRACCGGYYIFIDDDWKYCGCFLVNSLSLLNAEFVFGTKIINGIFFISADLENTIDLDYYEENNVFYIEKRILK